MQWDVTNKFTWHRSTTAVLEGSVLVNMGKPRKYQSFTDYCSEVFTSQLKKDCREYSSERTDLFFNTYKQKSLKGDTRVKRGKGVRKKQRLGKNKTELFQYISTEIISKGWNEGDLVCVFNDLCISSTPDLHLTCLDPCNYVEADTRIFCTLETQQLKATPKL